MIPIIKKAGRYFSGIIPAAFYGIAAFSQSAGSYIPCQEMPFIMQQCKADETALIRFYSPAADAGQRGGGVQSATRAPECRDRLTVLWKNYLDRLNRISFSPLSQECKVDYILFKRNLNEKIRQAVIDERDYNALSEWFPFAGKIYATENLRKRGLPLQAEQIAKDWSGILQQLTALQQKLAVKEGLTPGEIRKAGEIIAILQKDLKDIFDFYNGYNPQFSWWVPKAYKELDQSLTAYTSGFQKKLPPADKSGIIARKPAGREEMINLLTYEMINYTPEELIQIANKEFAWCEQEMIKASTEMGFGNNWKAALEKVKNSFVPPGKQPEAMLQLYQQSVDFLKKHDLITIPPLAEETWGMDMMSPQRQRTNAFFTGGWELTISYPTDAMSFDDRMMSMRGNNPHFSRATVHHELIAGHNLEFYMNARNRTYRDFGTPFWIEGWSLYWELLLWDMNFPRGPEDRIGMLFWHMHRCARIIFSFQFHLGKWTPQQCIDFLVDRVGHERANAESEIRGPLSGNSNPLYQIAYLTGGREFYALKKELVDGGKMTYKQFHDAVMQLNEMPVEMIRAILTNQPLTPSFKTSWRFYPQ